MSKELKAFGNKVCPKNCIGDCRECERVEKSLKALEIIKKKNILLSEIKDCTDYNDYLMWYNICKQDLEENEYLVSKLLTKEEFELLKEVLK